MSEALVEVRAGSGAAVLGRLDAAHLADHPAAVAALRACLAVCIWGLVQMLYLIVVLCTSVSNGCTGRGR